MSEFLGPLYNAIYQYILKLRQEIPEAIRRVPCEPPSDLQLDQISRHGIYREVLKQAAASRLPATDSASDPKTHLDASAPKTESQAPSPLSDHARALMYGKDPDTDASAATDTDPDQSPPKKNAPPPSLIPWSWRIR